MNRLVVFLFFSLFCASSVRAFPVGRCYDRPCSSSPYGVEWTSVDNTNGVFCFRIVPKPCINTNFDCCNKLAENLHKIVFSVNPICKTLGRVRVTVNGVRKTGGVFLDNYENESELRITSMTYNISTVTNATFCIQSGDPCKALTTFCQDENGICKYSIFDPQAHICCPTCELNTALPGVVEPPLAGQIIDPPPPPPPSSRPPPAPKVFPMPMVHRPPPPQEDDSTQNECINPFTCVCNCNCN